MKKRPNRYKQRDVVCESGSGANLDEELMRSTTGPQCRDVRAYLQQPASLGAAAPPPAWLVEHTARCATCRGAIALLAAELIAPSLEECAACQEGLAAYVDLDLAEGAASALRTYPMVGWHLRICHDCAEIYRLTRALERGIGLPKARVLGARAS